MDPSHTTASPWQQEQMPGFPVLDRDIEADVLVVGAGITGVTTAWLLRRAGRRVTLIDRAHVGAADSGHTTAHLTQVTDERLHQLVKHFGDDAARAIWAGGAAAIDQIADIVQETGADCDFRRLPGYLHLPVQRDAPSSQEEQMRLLRQDAELATRLGFQAQFIEQVPHASVPGVRFDGQATFNPARYIATLVAQIPGEGSHVFERTALASIDNEPRRARTAAGHQIRCQAVVLAGHNPLAGSRGALPATLLQTKLSLHTSYVLGARAPAGELPDALFWDTADPYDYLRIEPRGDHQLVIFGGADAKTGQENDAQAFPDLQRRLAMRVPRARVTHRWLGQVIETDDGLPYIGEYAPGEFIATGFGGNGFTFGTLAAMMARDSILGRTNPWQDLLRVDRKPFHGGLWRFVRENLDYPRYLLRDRFDHAAQSLAEVPTGEGRIVALDAGKCAVYRHEDGRVSICSAVCTHLKCLVHWNAADRTWDCPCHGSRFNVQGEVLAGPAQASLRRIQLGDGDSMPS